MIDNQTFAGLIDDPHDVKRIAEGIFVAVNKSFEYDNNQNPKQSEVKRRFELCVDLFKQLRGDLQWGVGRILDHMPRYLRNELDGIAWTPDPRRTWVGADA